ncbi:MAG: hypothetical protein HZB76_01305 [Chlamydiae bacterium]|nr:hypothetical protein [Chlamydiota bacterium]
MATIRKAYGIIFYKTPSSFLSQEPNALEKRVQDLVQNYLNRQEISIPKNISPGYFFRLARGAYKINQLKIQYSSDKSDPFAKKDFYFCQTSLSRLLYDGATLSVFKILEQSNESFKILLGGIIDNDGIGDAIIIENSASMAKKFFPKAIIKLVQEVVDLSKRKLPSSTFEMYRWGIFPTEYPEFHRWVLEDENKDAEVQRSCQDFVDKADVCIQTPHVSRDSSVFFKDNLAKNSDFVRIIENGGMATIERFFEKASDQYFFNEWQTIGCGVSPFENGFLWPKQIKVEITDLSDARFKAFLLDCSENHFCNEHLLQVGYLHNLYSQFDFLNICLAIDLSQGLQSKRVIDIILCHKFSIENEEAAKLFFINLSKNHDFSRVKDIYVYQGKGENVAIFKISLHTEGITLRLLNPFPLTHQDMLILWDCSKKSGGAIAGCTGDMSFLEVLDNKLAPFYAGAPPKKDFWQSFIFIAEEFLPNSLVSQYLTLLSRPEDFKEPMERRRKIAEVLQKDAFQNEWELFCAFLKKYYDFNEVLIDKITKMIAIRRFPELRKLDDAIFEKYLKQELSLKECNDLLQDKCYELQSGSLLENGYDLEASFMARKIQADKLRQKVLNKIYEYRFDHGGVCY